MKVKICDICGKVTKDCKLIEIGWIKDNRVQSCINNIIEDKDICEACAKELTLTQIIGRVL